MEWLYMLMFISGFASSALYHVGYVYLVEMMPKHAQNQAGLFVFLIQGIVMTYMGFQFCYLTSDVHVCNWTALALVSISMISVSFWLPESPRFLHSHKNFEKNREVMEKIARVNGKHLGASSIKTVTSAMTQSSSNRST